MNRLRRASVIISAVVAFAITEGTAYNVYRLGGQDGNPWPAALSFEPGEYLVIGQDGQIEDRIQVTTPTTNPTWNDTLAISIDSLSVNWLRPFWLSDTLNVAQDGVRNQVPTGLTDNLVVGGTNHTNGVIDRIQLMFDTDLTTAAFFKANNSDDPEIITSFIVQNLIVDLGANYPINRVRFFPRLGQDHPNIDQILEDMDAPKIKKEDLVEEDFSDNFLPWFELSAANSSANYAANKDWRTPEKPWFIRINPRTVNSANDPGLTILHRDRENQDLVVDSRFPLQNFQWIAIRPLNPNKNWEIAEFQVFGKGYVPRMVYTSTVLDLGTEMAWGKIRWKGTHDPDAKILIRTRSGSDLDPDLYWLPSNLAGENRQISRQEYDRGNIKTRFTTLDEENWSFWSSPYPWEDGLRDTSLVASDWQDGTAILSPGPARYMQLQIVVLSTIDHSVSIEELEIQFAPPAAAQVVGEIWPLDVERTESTSFTYSVRPTLGTNENQGFDRLEIFTLTRADSVRSVRVDGREYIDQQTPEILDDRIIVSFPRLSGQDDTFKLIEVEFDAHVVRYGTTFQGWVFDSEANEVKQLIDAGDATSDFPGNALGVRTIGLGAELIAAVDVGPNPFTPNGDGINDQVRFQFQLHELSTPRALTVTIYDLSGKQVRQLNQEGVVRGLFSDGADAPTWDGLDNHGSIVAPGIYLYRIALDADKGEEELTGTLSVAY